MTTYYLRTAGVTGSDDLDAPAYATKTFSQWRVGGQNGTWASGPPGGGDDIVSANIVSVPGLMGHLSVKTWTVQGSGTGGQLSSVNFINGVLTIDTIVIQGAMNLGIIAAFGYNPYDPGDPSAQSSTAVLNVTNTPIAAAEGDGSIINATNVGTTYTAAMSPWAIIALDGAIINAATVATSGADHLAAIVDNGTLNVSGQFNDWSNLLIQHKGIVTIDGTMDPAADSKTGPWNNVITVTGAGSKFTSNAETFTIGGGGAESGVRGALNVLDAGSATINGDFTIGDHKLDVGMVTIDGKGSRLTVNGDLTVANEGQGDLTVTKGGNLVVYGAVKEAAKEGAPLGTGGDQFSGAGVNVAIHGEWQIGVAADRDDTIDQGAKVTVAGDLTLGVEDKGVGTLNVTGAGTSLTITAANAEVTIGQAGIGILKLSQGAMFDAAASDVTVAEESAGDQQQNLLEIDNAEMIAGDLTIGGGGSGNLVAKNGAVLTVLSDMSLGEESGSEYSAQIQFSTLSIGGDLTVGGAGTPGSGLPVLDQNNKATGATTGGNLLLNASIATAASVTLGEEAEGDGALVMDLSSLTASGDLTIGGRGSGEAIVQLSSRLIAKSITLGEEFASTGSLSVDGSFVSSKDLTVGSLGKGSLTLTGGATVITTGDASLAEKIVANIQTASVSASVWSIDGDLTVGDAGIAQMTIDTGGLVQAGNDVAIGDKAGSGGILTIKGNGTAADPGTFGFGQVDVSGISVLRWEHGLTIGGQGTGTLAVTDGALVAPLDGGMGEVEVGAEDGSTGELDLSGGSSLIAKSLSVGGTADAVGGTGRLVAGKGDSVIIAEELHTWQSGTIDISGGGTIAVGEGAATTGGIAISDTGTLSGAGTIIGAISDDGLIEAKDGTLLLHGGLSGEGTVRIDGGATLDLSQSGTAATIGILDDLATLHLGSTVLTVTGSYTNLWWGSGDGFDPFANVSGQIVGEDAALSVLGEGVARDKDGLILRFSDIGGGLQQARFSLENSGTGATITVALQTFGLDAGDVTGITAGNVTLASGESSTEYTLTYDPSAGSLDGQTLRIVSNFANVAPITIALEAATPLTVAEISTTPGGEAKSGDTVAISVVMTAAVTVDTTGGLPLLRLNDGATAQYNAAASNPAAGALVFDYIVGMGDTTPDLAVAQYDGNGATIRDAGGNDADFAGAVKIALGVQINPAFVLSVTPSTTIVPAPNSTVHLTLALSQNVNLSGGSPVLSLNDGGTAQYDAAASTASALVFDYLVGAGDQTADLAISGVNLNGAAILDPHGVAADLTGALNVPTHLRIGASPLTVTAVAASRTGALTAGTVNLTLTLSEPVTVDLSAGSPVLDFGAGGTARYDAALSNPAAGLLVFGYTATPGLWSPNLTIAAVRLNGALIRDGNGYGADFSNALGVPTGIAVGVTGVALVTDTAAAHPGAGDVIAITLTMNQGVSVTGAPMLILNDGGTATYDAGASTAGRLTFDYTVGASDFTTDLQVSAVALNGGAVLDGAGHAADLSGAAADLGLDVNAVHVEAVTAAPGAGIVAAGQTVQVMLDMSAAVTVTGAPLLSLNGGATAGYDATSSAPDSGMLVFDYVTGAADASPDLTIGAVNLNGGSVLDGGGHPVTFAGATARHFGPQIGAKLAVASVGVSPSGEADMGDVVRLTLAMTEAVTVTGSPVLTLNDGGAATYSAAESNPATGTLVFDYVVGADDSTTNLAITGVGLSAVSAVRDAAGFSADFANALNVPTDLVIGPAAVASITASTAGLATAGQVVRLTLAMTAPVTVTGAPSLTLNDGAVATYDAGLSTPTSLVFDDTVAATDQMVKDLRVVDVVLPQGGSIVDAANGKNALLAGAIQVGTGVQISSPLSVASIAPGQTGVVQTGGTVQLSLTLNEDGILDTTGGVPTLLLNDGGTAIYNGDTSGSPNNYLSFLYTVGPADQTADLRIEAVNLNGASFVDALGFQPDFTAALNTGLGVQVNPIPSAGSIATNYGDVATTGDTVFLTIYMNESVAVTGTPSLVLNDGGTATFQSISTFQQSQITFGYTVAPGDQIPNLSITAVDLNGGSIQNGLGVAADFSGVVNVPTGLQIGTPLTIAALSASPSGGEIDAGQTVQFTLTLSEAAILDTGAGAPVMELSLASGHPYDFSLTPAATVTAAYDAAASDLASGKLVFDYTVAAGAETTNLQVSDVALNGATLTDAKGFAPYFLNNGALQIGQSTGLQIGPAFVDATFNLASDLESEANAGQTLQLILRTTAPATVTGTPTITLNNGATATYDPAASDPSFNWIAFDYPIGPNDNIPELTLSAVNFPSGAAIKGASGLDVDVSTALGGDFFVQIGPDTVSSVGTFFYNATTAHSGQTVPLKIELEHINLTVTGGTPTLTLSNGGIATYDAKNSRLNNSGDNVLVFNYAIGDNDAPTDDLLVSAVNLNGATIQDTYGTPADFALALNASTGMTIDPPPSQTIVVPDAIIYAYPTGYQYGDPLSAGETLKFYFYYVAVTGGSPTITLNDGGVATYDTALSTSSYAVFDYTVGPNDRAGTLDIAGAALNGATALDTRTGASINFAGASLADFGFQVGPTPLVVKSLTASTALASEGQVVQLTMTLNEAVTINAAPSLTLNDGGTAFYDDKASDPASGSLVFDYTVGAAEATLDLQVTGINQDFDPGPLDAAGYPPDYTGGLNVSTGLQISPLGVSAVIASPAGPTFVGETIHVSVKLNEAVSVDTAGGAPTIALNDGGTGTYDAAASRPGSGVLTFDYLVGAADQTENLAITGLTLPAGTTVRDASGYFASFGDALNAPTGLRVGPSPLFVAKVSTTPGTGEVAAGQTITLTLAMNEAVTVKGGTPTLTLNDGGTARYDAAASNPTAGTLVFDDVVGATEHTPNLAVTAVHLNGATVADGDGAAADFSAALNLPTGLQVGAAFVTSVQTHEPGPVTTGDQAHVALYLSQGVTVTGTPAVTLNNGGSALYDMGRSAPGGGMLVFDYTVGLTGATPDLTVSGVDLPGGATILDAHGVSADLSGVAARSTGLAVSVACFAGGTRIQTPGGAVAVEDLAVGDVVCVVDGTAAPIVWAGRRAVDCRRHPDPDTVWPVRVAAGAFGPGRPGRDLWLSPDHAVFLNGGLVPVKLLVNGTTIKQVKRHRIVYHHVELPTHAIILAENLPVESYLDSGDRANFAGHDTVRLVPDLTTRLTPDVAAVWETRAAAPLILTGEALAAARRIAERYAPASREAARTARTA